MLNWMTVIYGISANAVQFSCIHTAVGPSVQVRVYEVWFIEYAYEMSINQVYFWAASEKPAELSSTCVPCTTKI